MKNKHFLSFFAILAATSTLFFQACTDDKMQDTDTCITSNVKFSSDIVPILQASCFNGCHSGANPSSGFSLETYAAVKAKESRLFGAVSHQAGFVAMPFLGGKLSDCNISKIKAWLDAGAPNN